MPVLETPASSESSSVSTKTIGMDHIITSSPQPPNGQSSQQQPPSTPSADHPPSTPTAFKDVQDVVVPMIVQCHQLQQNATRRPSAPPVPQQAPSTTARFAASGVIPTKDPELLKRLSVLGFFGHTLHVGLPSPTTANLPDHETNGKANGINGKQHQTDDDIHHNHTHTTTHSKSPSTSSPRPLPNIFSSLRRSNSPSTHPPSPLTVQCEVRTRIPSEWGGEPHLLLYSNSWDSKEHLALVYGNIRSTSLDRVREDDTEAERAVRGARDDLSAQEDGSAEPPLARIHSCCFTGETLGSVRCDCREQLQEAMRLMAIEGRGVILYLMQEGRGIGLREKLRAYNLIDQGYDTMEANVLLGHPPDARGYEIASAILRDLNIASVRLLTNNPDKMASMEKDGVTVAERVPMVPLSWHGGSSGPEGALKPVSLQDRDEYLIAKVQRMGHILDIPQHVLSSVEGQKRQGSQSSLQIDSMDGQNSPQHQNATIRNQKNSRSNINDLSDILQEELPVKELARLDQDRGPVVVDQRMEYHSFGMDLEVAADVGAAAVPVALAALEPVAVHIQLEEEELRVADLEQTMKVEVAAHSPDCGRTVEAKADRDMAAVAVVLQARYALQVDSQQYFYIAAEAEEAEQVMRHEEDEAT
ncbi:GTP cyclohydrolase II [Phlyctochytrium planicorne]|nr:GTP cyclohydrolase II [Phlyctochytrium planicorne]